MQIKNVIFKIFEMFLLLKAFFCLDVDIVVSHFRKKKKVSNVEVRGTINCHSKRYLTKEVVFYQRVTP